MAFPYLSENSFELGTRGHFDAESDSAGRLDFPHYSDLAGVPGLPAPYRGAYCMRVALTSTTDAYVQETGSWDTAGTGTIFFRIMFWVSPNITMADTNEFAIFQMWSATNTVEGGAYINFTTANGLRLGIGETSASSFLPLSTGVWHCLELKFTIDPGANDGTIDAWLDGSAFTQVASLDQGDITSGVMGVLGQDAGTTKGVILFDSVIAGGAQIYPPTFRFSENLLLTSSSHAFVGPGYIYDVSLLSGAATDNVLAIYDTDVGNTNDITKIKCELKNVANNETVTHNSLTPIEIKRGCYVSLSGTGPRAILHIRPHVAWGSDGAIRGYGARRIATPMGV